MARVKRGVTARARHKKVLGEAKGYYGARRKVYRVAKQAVIKAGQYSYRDRRAKKREFRRLWIVRINAAARQNGLSYSRFMDGLNKADIDIDRKVLADLAVHDAAAFGALAEKAKATLVAKAMATKLRLRSKRQLLHHPPKDTEKSGITQTHYCMLSFVRTDWTMQMG